MKNINKHKCKTEIFFIDCRVQTAAATKLDNVLDNMFAKWQKRQNMSMHKNQGNFRILTSVTLIVVASLCCSNLYDGDFVFDDSEAIINNKDVTSTPIAEIFLNDFWGTKISHKYSHKSYRSLTILTFRLQHWLTDSLDPRDFHILNIVLHKDNRYPSEQCTQYIGSTHDSSHLNLDK